MYSVSAAPDSVMIAKGMGTHYMQVQLQVGITEVGAAAGRLLFLETTLYVSQGTTRRQCATRVGECVGAVQPSGEIRLPVLLFLVTNAQVRALEEHRNGDLRLEVQVNAVLPRVLLKASRARAQVTEYISIAESRWRQQLAGARPHARRRDADRVPRR